MTPKNVLAMAKEKGARAADIRFLTHCSDPIVHCLPLSSQPRKKEIMM
jgi:hypothetical protein